MVDGLIAKSDRCGIFVFANKNETSDFMVNRWERLSREAIRERGFFVAALSGGRTPGDFYTELSRYKEESVWNKTHLFLADERLVPFTDADSNYGMLKDLLLGRVNMPSENCHPISGEGSSPEVSAKKYEEDIREFFRLQKGMLPEFDLILLGIGKDGHTASIFPGEETLKERTRLAVAVKLDDRRHDRITLTLPVINNARNIVFLVTGREKAAIIKKIVEEKDVSLPASLVNPERGNLSFLLDSEAGSLLSPKFQCSVRPGNTK